MSVQITSTPNARIDQSLIDPAVANGELSPALEKQLFELSNEAKTRAYAPYSKFRVGAAVITPKGNVYLGCNVENASFGGTRCAEQTAFLKAVSEGENQFFAVGVTTDTDAFISPCGICRQFMNEWGGKLWVYHYKPDGTFKKFRLRELLPESFGPDDLDRPLI
ncbi:cytidine deaminase-like protein [Phlyctochytrium arcticum]|nr:cytidine deaminase-like protein [Phlyctochytrium arcticum]